MRSPVLAVCALAFVISAACTPKKSPVTVAAVAPAAAHLAEGSPQIADSADGVHIEYRLYAHGDPAVVLVHGWLANANYWHAQLPDLTARYSVVTLDLAGHGASGRNRSDWSIEHYAQDVAAVAHRLPNGKIVLVGHGMGAVVALAAAANIGERLTGIVAIDALKTIGQARMADAHFDALLQPFRADFIGHMHDFVGQYLFAKNAQPALVRNVADDMAHASPEIAIASLQALFRYDFATVLPGIKVPIIAINSDLNMPTDVVRIKKSAPTFRCILVPGSGHFLMLESPQRFNPILLQAIDALSRSR